METLLQDTCIFGRAHNVSSSGFKDPADVDADGLDVHAASVFGTYMVPNPELPVESSDYSAVERTVAILHLQPLSHQCNTLLLFPNPLYDFILCCLLICLQYSPLHCQLHPFITIHLLL